MTTNTPTYLFPYPDPGDAIANGDDTIKALAQRMELVLSAGDVADTWLAASQNIAGGATGNVGSILVPATYRRRNLVVAVHFAPAAGSSIVFNLTPNYGDPRIVDPGRALRQSSAASTLEQVAYFHFGLAAGAAGTTQFNLSVGGATALNSVRARAWVI